MSGTFDEREKRRKEKRGGEKKDMQRTCKLTLPHACIPLYREWYLHPVFAAAVSEGAGVNAAYQVGARNGALNPALQAFPNELFPNCFR